MAAFREEGKGGGEKRSTLRKKKTKGGDQPDEKSVNPQNRDQNKIFPKRLHYPENYTSLMGRRPVLRWGGLGRRGYSANKEKCGMPQSSFCDEPLC